MESPVQIIIFINMQPNCCGKTVLVAKHWGVVLKVTEINGDTGVTKKKKTTAVVFLCMAQNNLHVSQLHHVFPNTRRAAEQEHRIVVAEHRNFRIKASSPSLCWVTLWEWTRAAAIHQPEMMRAHGVHAEGGRSGCAACRWPVPRPGTFDPPSSVGLTCCCDLNHAHFTEGGGSWHFQ